MNLPYGLFDGDVNIQTFLCQPDKTIIGEIRPYDYNGTLKFNTYSEISFTIDRWYSDLIDGVNKINPYYDLIDSLRVIYLRGVGHFVIQDVDEDISENESKTVTCFSLEYSAGQKYLENFYVNTGEEGSVETMYHAQQYGAEYAIDDYYELASKKFDAYIRYYVKQYSDNDTWNYVETQITDAEDFLNYDEDLYVKKYPNVQFYWPECPELSLLHLVFSRIPEWKIGHVDADLCKQERTFSEDRTSVYDFLYNTAAETLKFVMVWDSINGVCNFYSTTEDGLTTDRYIKAQSYVEGITYYLDNKGTPITNIEDFPTSDEDIKNGNYYINAGQEVDTQWETDVFISKANLTNSINVKYSTDDIKTKLKISGSDDLDIRDVNLGQNYILNLSFYNTIDWLGLDLHLKYNKYLKDLEQYSNQYSKLISEWSAAYNKYSDLMNYVPIEPRVMLIGDKFEKLYCVYSKYIPATEFVKDTTYYVDMNGTVAKPQPTTTKEIQDGDYYIVSADSQVGLLQNKLHLYQVDQQDNGNRSTIAKTDDVLLTLENDKSDSVTIRVRYDQDVNGTDNGDGEKVDKTHYKVYRTYTTAATGVINTTKYPLEYWVNGDLTAEVLGVSGFKVKSIGTLGAYLCIAKDETVEENVEEYGIRLLEEKQSTYTKVFITQTEGYMSKEGAQCVVSSEQPEGNEIAEGTKWLDVNATDADGELVMYIYKNKTWVTYDPDENQADFKNYRRFYDNYQKLSVVQSVLAKKQKIADYLLNGQAVNAIYISNDDELAKALLHAIIVHFMVGDNKSIVLDATEDAPTTAENGTILFRLDEKNTTITKIEQYNGSSWIDFDYTSKLPEITLKSYSKEFKMMTFTIGTDTENEYAVYTTNGTPYVSYAYSQGVCLAKMNALKTKSDMNNYFTEQELVRLSPYIREDEYSDSNFLLTSYESEEEQMFIKQELLKAGTDELKKICQPKLSFDATMANILAIPEFAPIKKQFKLGNFVRVGIRDGYVKRARLLEVNMSFDDPSDFSATFGDLISTRSEIDKHAELLQQAVSAGKSVASNQSKWQKGADKATALDRAINDGLKNASLSVGAADGQAITWDKYGIRGRKLVDGTTDQYEPQQFALINNKLVFTDDNWATSRAVVGEFEVEIDNVKQTMYGLLADALIGGYIQGTDIVGGSLKIGDGSNNYFQVDESGDVSIVQAGKEKYASADAVTTIDSAYKYSVQIVHTGKAVFSSKSDTATMTAKIYRRGVDATDIFKSAGVVVYWEKNPSETNWVPSYVAQNNSYSIILDSEDIANSAQISCYIEPTEEQIETIEKNYND